MKTPHRSHTSAAGRAQARAAITDWNRRKWGLVAKCGAHARSTGEPCRQLAMENGRCAYHGGKTPRGDQWHKRQWPKASGADQGERKLRRKLAVIERAEKKRQTRLAEMTGTERKRYRKWLASHRPGKASDRLVARRNRSMTVELNALLREGNAPDASPLDEIRAQLQQKIIDAEKQLRSIDIFR